MRIKENEGQTLLSLFRLAVVALACLAIGSVQVAADKVFFLTVNAEDSVKSFLAETQTETKYLGSPVSLYYKAADEERGGQNYIFEIYYLSGSEGDYGLVDATGAEILPERYEGIRVLPEAYALKEAGKWRFYDRNGPTLLSEEAWDSLDMDVAENGMIETGLLCVGREGLYGAVDLKGDIVIEPLYEDFRFNVLEVEWPLILVKKEGYFGFIDSVGNVVIPLVYDYAVMDTALVYADENDAEGTEVPIIYVLKGEDWGAIYRNNGAPTEVDWSVDPTGEVLAAYREEV